MLKTRRREEKKEAEELRSDHIRARERDRKKRAFQSREKAVKQVEITEKK